MLMAEKYDWLTSPDSNPARAVHRRLGREVVIHAVDQQQLNGEQRKLVRTVGSNLGQLDHPAIPYLFDFIEEAGTYFLVVESFPETTMAPAATLLDDLRHVEMLTDALIHASQRDIAHGNLSVTSLGTDGQGHAKLLGLGLRQLEPHRIEELSEQDFQHVYGLVEQRIVYFQSAADQDQPELLRQISELRSILDQSRQITADRRLATFHDAIRGWVERECGKREAKKLSFASDTEHEEEVLSKAWFANPIVIGIAVTSVLVGLLLGILLWPRTVVDTEPHADGHVASRADTTVAESRLPATGAVTQSDTDNTFVSDLANIGALNNPEQAGQNQADEIGEDTHQNADQAETAMPEEVAEQEAKERESDTEMEAETTKPPAETSKPKPAVKPFADLPSSVSLPAATDTAVMTLVETKLASEAPLDIRLSGGEGAYKQGEFTLSPTADGWTMDYSSGQEKGAIAQLRLNGANLEFRWNEDLGKLASIAGHVRNTVLLLHSGEEKHAFALREFEQRPAIRVNLERRKPYDITFSFPPQSNDVIVEFLATADSLAKAIPKSHIDVDEKMRIGLDAGKNSLVVLLVEPKFKSRTQALSMRASARIDKTKSSRFVPVKAGASAKLRNDSRIIAQTLFQLKAAKKKVKDKVRDRVEQQIDQLEKQKERLEAFSESYLAAAQTKLSFRIYRQIGPHQVPLVAFGAE